MLEGHTAPIVALAVSPDGATLASASWDQTVRLWPLAGGAPRVLEGHTQNVNGVAFAPDSRTLVSVSYDRTLRIWPLSGASAPTVVALPAPLNAVAVAGDGEIAAGGADGKLLSSDGRRHSRGRGRGRAATGDLDCDLAGRRAGRRGEHWRIGSGNRSQDARSGAHAGRPRAAGVVGRVSAGQPHSADRRRRPHHPALERGDGRPDRSTSSGSGGRSAGRLCRRSRRRNLSRLRRMPYAWRRAGQPGRPTLAGIFGRRIATLPGYNFSEALKQLDIVWTPETVSRLFEIGPSAYTPGTKMPEQRIGSEQDRAALVQFLERATRR